MKLSIICTIILLRFFWLLPSSSFSFTCTTAAPSNVPTQLPNRQPTTTIIPSMAPSNLPPELPSQTMLSTTAPSMLPSQMPSQSPTKLPTAASVAPGTVWTSQTSEAVNQWKSVTFGTGIFVALAQSR